MKNLIGMVDFVLDQEKIVDNSGDYRIFKKAFNLCEKYAHFLKQPLELWMFVPCDENGNVLEYVKNPYEEFCDKENVCRVISKEEIKYQQAKERCLFDGFELKEIVFNSESIKTICLHEFLNVFWLDNEKNKWDTSAGLSTLEDLIKYNLQLTPTAIKQLSL
jgi:hypothetical protein